MFENEKKYLGLLALINVPILAIILVFNYWVDSSSNHHLPDEASIWPRKTDHSPASKLHYLAVRKPEIVFFGSSRVEVGLPPLSPVLAGQSVYNAGLSGSSFGDIAALATHYLQTGTPRMIVVGIDFLSFRPGPGRANLDYSLLVGHRGEYWVRRAFFDLKESLSFDALDKNLRSARLWFKGEVFEDGVTPKARLGQQTDEHMEEMTAERGKAAEAFRKKIELAFAPPPKPSEIEEALAALEQMVVLACSKGVSIRIFVNPQHSLATHFMVYHGEWSRFEAWKMSLAALASRHIDICDLTITDFSGYNSITSESISDLAPTRGLTNYWEASHYKSRVGELILRRLFLPKADGLPADFGRPLRLDTVHGVNHVVRAEQSRFILERSPELVQACAWVKPEVNDCRERIVSVH